MFLQIGVRQRWSPASLQAIVHPENDVASAFGGVEDARAITKSASRSWQDDDAGGLRIESANRFDRVGNLLAVGSHVLHRSSPDAAGNAAETFDPRAVLHNRLRDEIVPIDASAHAKEDRVALVFILVIRIQSRDSADGDF